MKKIIKQKEIDILEFIKENLNDGYNIYSNIDDINELVDIIVKWYEFKYPEEKLFMIKKRYECEEQKIFMVNYKKYNLSQTENISKNMGYCELMFRIPSRLHSIVECWYKGNGINEVNPNYININIYDPNSINLNSTSISVNKYDGYLHTIDRVLFGNVLSIDPKTIEELFDEYVKIKESEFFIKDIRNTIITHNLDLELRKKIFELIALKLLCSTNDIAIGYVRSKKFIDEFNRYIYDSYVDEREINNIVNDMNLSDFYKIPNFILKQLDKNKKEDELYLSFETLKLLRLRNIYTLSDLKKDTSILFDNEISQTDKELIEIKLKADNITSMISDCNMFVEEKPIIKRKERGIFRRKIVKEKNKYRGDIQN